ncbi:hypothetical protein AcV5_000438 [Taiwanofungus camphoratus]|nr:hypothetical protein AcV7_003630 [Antrodia cinnamomea]KAI0938846.1 hypothetical protein AcV5_000438 [Antrodia cinnamomea]
MEPNSTAVAPHRSTPKLRPAASASCQSSQERVVKPLPKTTSADGTFKHDKAEVNDRSRRAGQDASNCVTDNKSKDETDSSDSEDETDSDSEDETDSEPEDNTYSKSKDEADNEPRNNANSRSRLDEGSTSIDEGRMASSVGPVSRPLDRMRRSISPSSPPLAPKRKTNEDRATLEADALAILTRLGYQGLEAKDFGKLNPPDVYEDELQLMAEVRGYFQVAYKRVIDTVPLTIEHEFLFEFADRLQGFLIQKLRLGSSKSAARCASYLAEGLDIVRMRNELLSKKKRLKSASVELLNFGLSN